MFDQIDWSRRLLTDSAQWEWAKVVVQWLCNLGTVIEWLDGVEGKDSYLHMAYRYEIEERTVSFLPHWGYYDIEGLHLGLPTSEDSILQAVLTVTHLQRLGLHRRS